MDYRNISKETWKPISDNTDYAISNFGRIASVASKKHISVLHPTDNGKGYKLIKITTPKRKNLYIHRLVAHAFIPNPENKSEVNHKDGNKSNNTVENLEWVTLQENRTHCKTTGLILRGEHTTQSKLTEADVREIRRIFRGNPAENKTEVGRRFGVTCTTIIKIVKWQRWQHVKD
jgi:hypothetical protein